MVWGEVIGRITSGRSRVVGGLSESKKSLVSCGPVKAKMSEPIQSSLSTCPLLLGGCSGNGLWIRRCKLKVAVLPWRECMSLFLEAWREASKDLEGSLSPALTCKTRNYSTKRSPQTALWSEDRGSCPKISDRKHTALAFFKERALWSRRRLIDAPWSPSRTAAGLSGALGTLGGCSRL